MPVTLYAIIAIAYILAARRIEKHWHPGIAAAFVVLTGAFLLTRTA